MSASSFSSLTTRLGKNSLWLLAARIGTQGLGVLFTIILARRLGSAGFGEYAFIAAAIFLGNVFTTFGTDMSLIREIAARDDFSYLPAALLIQLALSGLVMLLAWFGGGWIPNQSLEAIQALQIYSLALIPLAFFTVFTIALRGRQHMRAYTLLNLAISILQLGAVFFLIQPDSNIVTLSVLLLSVQTLAALLAGIICAIIIPNFSNAWHFSLADISPVLKAAAPVALIAILGMVYQKLSISMLSTMRGPVETGIFSAAARAVEASKTIHVAVFAALFPVMAQANGAGAEFTEALRASWKLLLGGAMLAALILTVCATPLVLLLYGADFALSAGTLQILAWSLIPYTVSALLTLSLLAAHQETVIVGALTATLLGLAAISLWWIPLKGAEGAAWALVVAECFQASLLLLGSLRFAKRKERYEFSQLS